jgi:hypothetical protein
MTALFDSRALQHLVEKTLTDSPEVPEGKRGAFLTVANQEGIRAVIAVKVDDRWTLKAVVEHPWASSDTINYGVEITGTF